MTEFVEGWTVMQTLGEGSYGEVRLLVNRNTGSAVAMKMVDLIKHPNARNSVRKEALILHRLNHSNVISYYGQRQDRNYVYMFLEYCSGGELFDRIEPDVGMQQIEAQKYFTQLIAGVEYLHTAGIAHRDLKPENLLLDNYGNLKISDFGMATFFRLDGKERLLESRCGTLPYIAPEVLETAYAAEPADLWSCGIVLVALLSGELPWDKPTAEVTEYVLWKENRYMQATPWSKINTLALSLIKKILIPNPKSRYTLSNIKVHRWYCMDFGVELPIDITDFGIEKVSCHDMEMKLCYSQPEESKLVKFNGKNSDNGLISFSQPTQIDDLLVSTQFLASQSIASNTNYLQKFVKRMTRFFVNSSIEDSIDKLNNTIKKLNYTWKSYSNGVVTIATVDRRKSALTFKCNVLKMEDSTLLDFRLSKGCGIEFKKCYIAIKREFHDEILARPDIPL